TVRVRAAGGAQEVLVPVTLDVLPLSWVERGLSTPHQLENGFGGGLVFDPLREVFVFFGGFVRTQLSESSYWERAIDETWELDLREGGGWSRREVTGPGA